jgi:hypothetical protein
MIRQERGLYSASCDGCGATINTGLRSMQQVANYLSRAEGWDSRKLKHGWRNYCPQCAEEADPDRDVAGVGFIQKPGLDD